MSNSWGSVNSGRSGTPVSMIGYNSPSQSIHSRSSTLSKRNNQNNNTSKNEATSKRNIEKNVLRLMKELSIFQVKPKRTRKTTKTKVIPANKRFKTISTTIKKTSKTKPLIQKQSTKKTTSKKTSSNKPGKLELRLLYRKFLQPPVSKKK